MIDEIKAWWEVRRNQISTKLGVWLGAVSVIGTAGAQQLSAVNSQAAAAMGAIGGIAAFALVVWNQSKGQAGGQ